MCSKSTARWIGDPPQVCVEVSDIDTVEAYERREQTDVGLSELIFDQPAPPGKTFFQPVQNLEQALS